MDVRTIYEIDGYINKEGEYEALKNCFTYIAECKIYDKEGLSYYAFLNRIVDPEKENDEGKYINSTFAQLESIGNIYADPSIRYRVIEGEKSEKFKTRFKIEKENYESSHSKRIGTKIK